MKKLLLISLLSLLALVAKSQDEITYPDFFPEYSWDKVSVYAHVGSSMDFSKEEYDVLSQFPIVCLNGSTGQKEYGGSDKGTAIVGAKLKAMNPNMKLLCYLSFNTDYSSRYSTGRVITETKNQHWILRNNQGKESTTNGTLYRLDKSLEEVRDYLVGIIDHWSGRENFDGIFIDSYAELSNAKKVKLMKSMGTKKASAFIKGDTETRRRIKETITSNRITIGNGVAIDANTTKGELAWLNTVSGGMMDHFAFLGGDTPDNIAASIERITEVGKQGKMIMVKGWPEANHRSDDYDRKEVEKLLKNARETITFPLACFLCGAQKYAYFCYSWAWGVDAGGAVMYDEYNKRLGEPKGDYKRKKYVFTREFEYASVMVNVKTKKAKIEWK